MQGRHEEGLCEVRPLAMSPIIIYIVLAENSSCRGESFSWTSSVRGPAAFAKNPDAAIRGTAGGSFVPRRSELPQEVVDDFIDDRFRSVGRVPIDHRSGFLAPAAGERGCACLRSCTRWRRPV